MRQSAIGKMGEDYTAQVLGGRGFTILHRNYHSRYGEIDLIGENGEYLVFVEVKARKPQAMSSPLESVTPQKQRRLILTAQTYLAEHPTEKQPRFDVAGVEIREGRVVSFEYLENAFFG